MWSKRALLHKSVIFDSLARIVNRLWVLGDSGANYFQVVSQLWSGTRKRPAIL
ncbi:MAG: hypothetical protein K940chlam2_00155 [Chlamydiae bacterium]|nr:hypothetical protein [Chlamydiota bacterium]